MHNDDHPSKVKTRAKRLSELLESLGKLRDGILVGASVFYLTGYGIWAIITWKRRLGPLPVLDAQYFVAGFPVLLAVALGAAVLWSLREALIRRWPSYVARQRRIRQIVLVGGLATAAVIAFVVFFVLKDDKRYEPIAVAADLAFLILTLFILHSDVTIVRGRWMYTLQPIKQSSRYLMYLMVALAFLVLVTYYVTTIYTAIPQALGGAKPRIAQIDVETKDLSTETLNALGISGRVNAVARSKPLPIFFAGSATIVLQTTGNSSSKVLIELPRSVITAFEWQETQASLNYPETQPNKQIQPTK
jgi:hypothetical protein